MHYPGLGSWGCFHISFYGGVAMKGKKRFNFVIGNPPYQEDSVGGEKNYTSPIYHIFMDEMYKIADKVELIHPARCLFDVGGTPTEWNKKILNDPSFKIMKYETDSERLFPNVNINGGVVISYRDERKNFGAIEIFTSFQELNSILKKITSHHNFSSFSDIMANRGLYRFSTLIYKEHPDIMKKFSDPRIGPRSFSKAAKLFYENEPKDGYEYAKFFGLLDSKRVYRWFRKDYFKMVESFNTYKVFISKADGAAGAIGNPIPARIIGKPIVMGPGIGCTETYITVGAVATRNEAESIAKYIMSKFARVLLGVLKVTQNSAKPTWKYVPLQDFTSNSDIDWSKSIREIDKQLYKKYGLDDKEIEFIETHVKEME